MSSLCLETNMLLSKFRDFSSENAATNVENRNRFSQILNEDASPDFLHLASSVGRSGAFNRVVHSPLHQNRLVSSISPIESDLHLRISKASFEDAEAVVRVNPIMRLNVADRVIFATQYKEMSSAS